MGFHRAGVVKMQIIYFSRIALKPIYRMPKKNLRLGNLESEFASFGSISHFFRFQVSLKAA